MLIKKIVTPCREIRKEWGHIRSLKLDSLILFITSSCNQRCSSCFYWRELNQKNDLTHEQLLCIADSAPPFRSLLLSGGEPFLRKGLHEILDRFAKRAGLKYLSVPTNGGYPDKIAHEVSSFLSANPEVFATVSVSIDGFKDTHEKIRGVPQAWELAIKSLERLKAMRKGFPNLRVKVNTCACALNIDELEDFADYVDEKLGVDYHNIEFIRGDPKEPGLHLDAASTHRYLRIKAKVAHRYYKKGRKNRLYHGPTPGISRFYMEGMELVQLKVKENAVVKKRGWPFPCLGGQTICVIDHDGSMRACELRDRILRLQDFDFDLKTALKSHAMEEEVSAIKRDQCHRRCTHGCFVDSSQKHSLSTILFRIPIYKLMCSLGIF